eukprot:354470-Chlamydomonas_euryale.AAC.35
MSASTAQIAILTLACEVSLAASLRKARRRSNMASSGMFSTRAMMSVAFSLGPCNTQIKNGTALENVCKCCTSHAVPYLSRPGASLRSAGDQRPHEPAAAAPPRCPQCLCPQCLPVPGHRHGQKAEWHSPADSSDVRGSGGAPAHAHPQCGEAHMPRLMELGGVGRPCSMWRDRAVAALSPVPMLPLAGWGWYGVSQDCA